MEINFKQIKNNFTNFPNRKIEYIVLHDTGNKNRGANAEMHYRYFNGEYRGASADFFVDETQVLQINDYKNQYSWAVGDGRGKYGITNRNSISIEMCINSDNNFEKTVEKTIELVAYLMKELNIPLDKVVRHYDASRKICARSMSSFRWRKWYKFKKEVEKKYKENNASTTINSPKILNIDEALKVLVENKIINSPDYWKKASSVVKYFDIFIINVANKLNR
jgi:N-acetylmuramoyl-L-alanine amidase